MVIAGVGLLAALGTVLARNLVHAALFLVGFFFTIACMFVLLEAEFLAAFQVLVYIGAVAIILMFGIMLTRNIQGDDTTIVVGAWRIPALIAGLCIFGILVFGINNAVAPAGRAPGRDRTCGCRSGRSRARPGDRDPPRGGQQHGAGRWAKS